FGSEAARVQLAGAAGDDGLAGEDRFEDFPLPAMSALQDGLDERAMVKFRSRDAFLLALRRRGRGEIEKALAVMEEVASNGRRIGAKGNGSTACHERGVSRTCAKGVFERLLNYTLSQAGCQEEKRHE